jgi:hypothetical protein
MVTISDLTPLPDLQKCLFYIRSELTNALSEYLYFRGILLLKRGKVMQNIVGPLSLKCNEKVN